MRSKHSVTLGLLLVLSGCATDGSSMPGVDTTWGEANKQTMAAQVIDPVPTYDTAVPATSGTKVTEAIQRYRTDKVKQPEKVRTTATISGSSGQ